MATDKTPTISHLLPDAELAGYQAKAKQRALEIEIIQKAKDLISDCSYITIITHFDKSNIAVGFTITGSLIT